MVYSQVGGASLFQFLNQSDNSRIMGVGGLNVSTKDDDVDMLTQNPSSLDSIHVQELSINYLPYFTDINKTSLLYTFNTKKIGALAISSSYISYGEFERKDIYNQRNGTFSARDFSFGVTNSHQINNISVGATMKFAGSYIDTYSSHAVAFDFGANFTHPKYDLQVGMVLKNIGFVFDGYVGGANLDLPMDLQIGVSYKPEYMPIRFSATGFNLLTNEAYYFDASRNPDFDDQGNQIEGEKSVAEEIFRRIIWGAELMFSEKFQIQAGYNHMRRQELKLKDVGGVSGFSVGGKLKIKGYDIGFTRAWYHAAGGTSVFSVSTNLSRYYKKTKVEGTNTRS